MTKGLQAALSSTCSTSRPIDVRRSQIASSVASVSRCSLSQERVNFMILSPVSYALKPPNNVGMSSGRKP